MMESGMFEELAGFYNSGDSRSTTRTGIHKAIGVLEFDRYFGVYPPEKNDKVCELGSARMVAYEEAVQEIKDNTWLLAKKQIERIMKLRSSGWEIHQPYLRKILNWTMRSKLLARPHEQLSNNI